MQQVKSAEFEGDRLSIIVPTYNERENLPLLVNELFSVLGRSMEYEIVVVDDNSPDGTGQVADDLSQKNGHMRVVHRPVKMGLASAVLDGVNVSNGNFVVVLDADLQHSPKLLKALLNETTNGAELIVASRYIDGAGTDGWNPWRKFVSRGATYLARALLPNLRTIKDPLSGYFMVRRSIIMKTQLSGIGWKILLEILAKCKYKQIVEVPYVFRSRVRGKSKLKLKDYVAWVVLIFKLMRAGT